jgi:flagellar assembly protein FliH
MPGSPLFATNLDLEIQEEKRRRAAGEDRLFTLKEHQAALDEATEAARTAAFQEGYEKGEADTKEAILAKCSESIAAIGPQIQSFLEGALDHHAHLERQMAGFAHSVARHVAPTLVKSQSQASLKDAIRETIAAALARPKLVISVSPAVQKAMGEDLEKVANDLGFEGTLQVTADPKLSDGAAQVTWDNGFMEYSYDAVCAKIMTALEGAAPSTNDQ